MVMLFIVILILALALYLPFDYGQREGESDAEKIAANGSEDSLKEKFHASNLLERSGVALVVVSAVTVVLALNFGFSLWFALPYALYFTAIFGYAFTLTLNRERGLADFYVSHDPRAAKMDQFMVRNSARFGMQPQSFSRLIHSVFALVGILLLIAFIVGKLLINNVL